jgi:hypothetical protein
MRKLKLNRLKFLKFLKFAPGKQRPLKDVVALIVALRVTLPWTADKGEAAIAL